MVDKQEPFQVDIIVQESLYFTNTTQVFHIVRSINNLYILIKVMVRWYGGKKMEESSSKPRKVHYRAHRHMPDYYFIRPNGPLWSWSYGSLMNNHLYYQCLSLLKLWVRIPVMARCTWYKICDNVCQWLAAVWLFSPGTPVSATKKLAATI
jgi:hypothetical protein